jgi:hypothetical protein
MDFSVLNRGEKIAGVAGVLLILIMFIFDWYSVKVAGISVPDSGVNAWDAYSLISIVLLITALAGIGLAVLAASDAEPGLPVAGSAIVCALGILSVVLIIFRIIDKPGGDVGAVSNAFGGPEVSVSLSIGVFLGLVCAAGIAVGGYLGMQEEGTSFAGEADRFRGGAGGPGAGPPPPPPPPPPTQPPPPPTQPPPPPASGP